MDFHSIFILDDEDIDDEREEIKLSSPKQSHLTITEHERFTKEKSEFKRKYTDEFNKVDKTKTLENCLSFMTRFRSKHVGKHDKMN